MNRILVFVLVIVSLLSGCAAPRAGDIEVQEAWMRPAAQGANGAVYFVIHNGLAEADELEGISSEAAEAVEMHESMMNGDIMEMHPLESVPLGAGEQVTFEPGGLHIMLVGLKEALEVGDEIQITLHFKNHPDMQVDIPISDTPVSDEDHSSSDH